MKLIFAIALSLSLLYSMAQSTSGSYTTQVAVSDSAQLVFSGNLAELYVEKVIYNRPESQNFFLKFTITNVSNKTIGIDLSNYWNTVYPNQWGIYSKPYREVIDEEQMIHDTTVNAEDLSNQYRKNMLTMVEPGKSISYFRDWNGSGEKIELIDPATFLIITVDGYILISNGSDFEQIVLIDADEKNRALVFGFPLKYETIPEEALIMQK